MRKSQKNFSLIELLVVIAVIAVLASILIPSMVFAREYARKAACINNQSQIIRIILSYANESNKDVTGVTENYKQWYAKLIVANGGKYKKSNFESGSACPINDADLEKDALSQGTRVLFRCPADFTKGTVSYARNDAAQGWTLKKGDGRDKPRLVNSRLSVLRRPSNLIMTGERWSDDHIPGTHEDQEITNAFHLRTWREGKSEGGDNTVDEYSSRHRGTAPVAYMDGHVVAGPFLNTVQGKNISNVKGWWETANGHWSDDPALKN